MRRTERPLSAVDGLLRPADRRPDADDIQPFVMRERRQDGRKPLGHHALARAGEPGEQDIVPAGGRDLERALDEVLPEHMLIVRDRAPPVSGSGGGGQGTSCFRPLR